MLLQHLNWLVEMLSTPESVHGRTPRSQRARTEYVTTSCVMFQSEQLFIIMFTPISSESIPLLKGIRTLNLLFIYSWGFWSLDVHIISEDLHVLDDFLFLFRSQTKTPRFDANAWTVAERKEIHWLTDQGCSKTVAFAPDCKSSPLNRMARVPKYNFTKESDVTVRYGLSILAVYLWWLDCCGWAWLPQWNHIQ